MKRVKDWLLQTLALVLLSLVEGLPLRHPRASGDSVRAAGACSAGPQQGSRLVCGRRTRGLRVVPGVGAAASLTSWSR